MENITIPIIRGIIKYFILFLFFLIFNLSLMQKINLVIKYEITILVIIFTEIGNIGKK